MTKRLKLQKLFKEMSGGKLPLLDQSSFIPGDGNPNSKAVFIGEAGGYYEEKQKRPFVGQAGKLLDKLLNENHLSRADIWITNVVKARPPKNRDPEPEEIEAYRPYLEQELEIIQPKVIVSLGRFAMNWFLPDKSDRAE